MACEESIVFASRALGASRQLDEHDAPRGEAAVEWVDGERGHQGLDPSALAMETTRLIVDGDRVDAGAMAIDQLRDDAQIAPSAVAIGQPLRGG